jgi:oligopeptidase B
MWRTLHADAGVPFVDVLTTMLDETIPLTTIEFEEWGNPQVRVLALLHMHYLLALLQRHYPRRSSAGALESKQCVTRTLLPLQDPSYYEYMKSYSPVDNIGASGTEYPNILVTAGLHDPRV